LAIIGSIFETFKGSNNLGLITVIIDYFAVARGGIEPPTHGFSVRLSQYTQSTVVCYQSIIVSCSTANYYLV